MVEHSKSLEKVLAHLEDGAFCDLIESGPEEPGILGSILAEEANRRVLGRDQIDALFARYLQASFRALQHSYEKLFSEFWSDLDTANQELADAAEQFALHLRPTTREELDWPWPISEPSEGKGHGGEIDFENTKSGLKICGYHVGMAQGLRQPERRRLLDHFFRNPLPAVVSRYHGDDYGEPGSEIRLRKMANVIAANCRNFKKNDRYKYRVAIADWENDLQYLKQEYFKAGMFPWPLIEP